MGLVVDTVPKISSIKDSILIGQVSNKTPSLSSVQNTKYVGSGRLWERHVLYNTHELYLSGVDLTSYSIVGSVENKTPKMYSIFND